MIEPDGFKKKFFLVISHYDLESQQQMGKLSPLVWIVILISASLIDQKHLMCTSLTMSEKELSSYWSFAVLILK